MFNKKDVEEIKEQLSNLSNKLSSLKENSNLQQDFNKELLNALSELKSNQSSYFSEMNKEVEEIVSLKDEFSKSVRTFELLHKRIYDQLYTRVHEVLREHTNNLKSTTESYNSTAPKVNEMLKTLDSLNSEISRFKVIAKNIREKDFELVNHQKNLERLDSEKLHLLKKIDSLQRVIGKSRRNQY
jgi:chromosome segregation ATPase